MPNSEPARVSQERCPFCGEDETEVAENVTGDIVSGRQVECQYCSARGPEVLSGAKAISAWNRRTPPTSPGWQDYERGLEDAAKAVESMPVVINFAPPKGLSIMDATRADIATAIRTLKSPAAPECGR